MGGGGVEGTEALARERVRGAERKAATVGASVRGGGAWGGGGHRKRWVCGGPDGPSGTARVSRSEVLDDEGEVNMVCRGWEGGRVGPGERGRRKGGAKRVVNSSSLLGPNLAVPYNFTWQVKHTSCSSFHSKPLENRACVCGGEPALISLLLDVVCEAIDEGRSECCG